MAFQRFLSKPPIQVVLLVLGGLVIFFALYGFVSTRLRDQTGAGYIQYYEHFRELTKPRIKADLVIMGTSHALHGINPRYLESPGQKFFNFGLPGAGPSYFKQWYCHLFRVYYTRPKLFLIGVDWFMFDDNVGKYVINIDRKFADDMAWLPWGVVLPKLFDFSFPVPASVMLRNKASILGKKEHLLEVITHDLGGAFPSESYYHGFIARNEPYYSGCDTKPENLAGKLVLTHLVKDFEALLDDIASDGARVVLVQTPELLPCRVANIQAVKLLHEIADRRGLAYLDYNTELVSKINYKPSCFSSWGHLNQEGSTRFTQSLKRDLADVIKGL